MQTLDYYLAVGGIPKYLEVYNPSNSFQENISKLCFNSLGFFYSEFERLFISHFGKAAEFRKIVLALGKIPLATSAMIETQTGLTSGGSLSGYLEQLILAGFVEKYSALHKPSSSYLIRYRLKDLFLRFFTRFIFKNQQKILAKGTPIPFGNIIKPGQFESWRGLAFEECCRFNH